MAAAPLVKDSLYVGGAWVAPHGTDVLAVEDPTTDELLATVPAGVEADVDEAVAAARAAFATWAATPVDERSKLLTRLADALTARVPEIARLIASEVGMPLRMATPVQAAGPAALLARTAELAATDVPWEEPLGSSLLVRQPVGVVAAITPWNYPLHTILTKVGPALAAGCTVVLKPSEVAPLTAFVLLECAHEVGLPAGVLNLVTGVGPVVGEALSAHPDVDMVSLTGSTRAGMRVAEVASGTVKRVALELGGKSASLVLEDADLPAAIKASFNQAYLNSGQTCTAWTRLVVPRGRHDEAVELAAAAASSFTVGDPLAADPAPKLGPLVSRTQQGRVRGYIEQGIDAGATLVVGGPEQPDGCPTGAFVRPTVFADVTTDMAIAREEIFGPVVSILDHDGDDHAVSIANDSEYGLHGAVFSADRERAIGVARRMRTGQVDVNGGRYNPEAPFGGYKRSGLGREGGRFGIEEYLEVTSLQL